MRRGCRHSYICPFSPNTSSGSASERRFPVTISVLMSGVATSASVPGTKLRSGKRRGWWGNTTLPLAWEHGCATLASGYSPPGPGQSNDGLCGFVESWKRRPTSRRGQRGFDRRALPHDKTPLASLSHPRTMVAERDRLNVVIVGMYRTGLTPKSRGVRRRPSLGLFLGGGLGRPAAACWRRKICSRVSTTGFQATWAANDPLMLSL